MADRVYNFSQQTAFAFVFDVRQSNATRFKFYKKNLQLSPRSRDQINNLFTSFCGPYNRWQTTVPLRHRAEKFELNRLPGYAQKMYIDETYPYDSTSAHMKRCVVLRNILC